MALGLCGLVKQLYRPVCSHSSPKKCLLVNWLLAGFSAVAQTRQLSHTQLVPFHSAAHVDASRRRPRSTRPVAAAAAEYSWIPYNSSIRQSGLRENSIW
jgi:hypothetical protein